MLKEAPVGSPYYTAFLGFIKYLTASYYRPTFKHIFHLENDALAYVMLKFNYYLCSEVSKTLRVFEIPTIFERVM